ncbi:hypothetical protein FE257_004792 [Aspergillus nanangensis]|uniref:Cytochrome P450 n=1 Tax=Aspergillus nanangensis TaxID=2582783 RepID=A0AAD4CSZ9_ASPNN|nr:hypothetical protein FE257_004792 [Aspergillus nanangensis]
METHISYYLLLGPLALFLYHFFIYPAFLCPLAKIPTAHWSCRFSSIWIYYLKWTNQENGTVYEKHMTLGPAVRLAPNLVSINCFEEGLKKIYQGGFPKPEFYWHGFAIYKSATTKNSTENIFTFPDNGPHAARKRIVSNTFSKSYVLASPTARAATCKVLFERYLPMLQKAAAENKPVEVLEMNYAYSMDTFVHWQYGRSLGSNLIEDEKERRLYLDGFFAPYPTLFWQYYFPNLAAQLRKIGLYLIPKSVDTKFGAIEAWNLDKCDRAQQLLASGKPLASEDQPVVFEQALKAMSDMHASPKAYPQRLQIASDMFAHNSAAFETSGNTETYLFYEMCRNPVWQTKLREEVLRHAPQLILGDKKVEVEDLPEPKDIDALPILHAIVMETLRLWPSVPGGQPRVVPRTCSLGGFDGIPAGTVVQSYGYILHRTPEVFPDPHVWKPERWLDSSADQLATMKRWFWAFTIKFLVASVYGNFTTSIHDHGSMELLDAYLAGPKGHRLEIKFDHVEG